MYRFSPSRWFFFLSKNPQDLTKYPYISPPLNIPLHIIYKILRNAMSSTAEAKLYDAFLAASEAAPICTTLVELGHLQPPIPIQVNNSTYAGLSNDTIRQKRTKYVDMKIYWLQDTLASGKFFVYWQPGKDNLANYPTKSHSASHHKIMRPFFLYVNGEQLANLVETRLMRGCHNSTPNLGSSIYIYEPSTSCIQPPINSVVLNPRTPKINSVVRNPRTPKINYVVRNPRTSKTIISGTQDILACTLPYMRTRICPLVPVLRPVCQRF